jgi:hypothetical protein
VREEHRRIQGDHQSASDGRIWRFKMSKPRRGAASFNLEKGVSNLEKGVSNLEKGVSNLQVAIS